MPEIQLQRREDWKRTGKMKNDDNQYKKVRTFNIINTNARSISPKIECFIEYLNELNTSVAFFIETWLTDGVPLQNDILDLEEATGFSMLYKNRLPNARGYSTGGVALAFRKSSISFKLLDLSLIHI